MDIENQEVIYCADDDDYRVYCGNCVKLCIDRYYKPHFNSVTHTKKIDKRQQFRDFK